MQLSLLIDTSDSIILGLCGQDGLWADYIREEKNKKSWFLHDQLHQILQRNKLALAQVEECLTVVGPGSYTGIRLSHGLGQILSWNGVKTYSVHHFDVPMLLGEESGVWATNAYKGEWFVHKWDESGAEQMLFDDAGMTQFLASTELKIFAYDKLILATILPESSEEVVSTVDLIKDHYPLFREKVKKLNKQVEPYYFRPLDKEFRSAGMPNP